MPDRLTKLIDQISEEKDSERKLALIQEFYVLLAEEEQRPKGDGPSDSNSFEAASNAP